MMMNLLLIFAIFYIAVASDLDPTTFKASVIDDTRVWLVEFYSPMCGSCTEFAPTWAKVESAMKSVSTGKINIDVPAGMELADKLGVLEEGLPNIRLFNGNPNGVSILEGSSDMKAKAVVSKVKKNISALTRRDDGFYLKPSQ